MPYPNQSAAISNSERLLGSNGWLRSQNLTKEVEEYQIQAFTLFPTLIVMDSPGPGPLAISISRIVAKDYSGMVNMVFSKRLILNSYRCRRSISHGIPGASCMKSVNIAGVRRVGHRCYPTQKLLIAHVFRRTANGIPLAMLLPDLLTYRVQPVEFVSNV